MNKKTQTPRKRTVLSRSRVISSTKRKMKIAQRALNAQTPAVIKQTTTIGTNDSWVNALEIARNPSWVAPRSGESYVWGENDPNGPSAVVARRFTINRSLNNIESATLFLAVDNFAIVLINGRQVVIDSPQATERFFNPGRRFNIRRFLRRGTNDIVVAAFNFPSNANRSTDNDAGVLARITIVFD